MNSISLARLVVLAAVVARLISPMPASAQTDVKPHDLASATGDAQNPSVMSAPAARGSVDADGQNSGALHGGTAGLSLPQAVQAATHRHPSVRAAAQQLLQAGEGVTAARAGYYPRVRGGIGSQMSNRRIGGTDHQRVSTVSLSVSQMLYDFGKVDRAVDQADAAVATIRAEAAMSVDDVIRETALAWLELYRQHALAQIAEDQVRGVQALAELVIGRERLGASNRSDVEQARSRVDAARAQLLDAQAQIHRWRTSVGQLTGLTVSQPIAKVLPPVFEGACMTHREPGMPPSVRVAQALRDEASAAVRLIEAQQLPTLTLEGSLSHGLNARSRLPGEPNVLTSVGLNVSAPLFEGGASRARERAAVYALSAADAAVERAQLEQAQALEDARSQSLGLLQRLPVLDSRLQSIRATRDLYQQQYLQLGTRSLLDLLNAEQEYHTVRFDQANSLHERHRLSLLCLYHTDQLRTVFSVEAQAGAAS